MRKNRCSQSDFTKAMLPQSRRAIFADVLKLHWQRLLLIGILLFAACIPLILTSLTFDSFRASVYHLITQSDFPAEEGQREIVIANLTRSAGNILLSILPALAIAGIGRVIRQYAWEKNVHLPTDLAKGIRDNGKQTAVLGVLSGIIYTLCLSVYYFSAGLSPWKTALAWLPIALSLLVVLPIFAISLVMIPVYSNKLGATLKNAFFIYTRATLKVLPLSLFLVALWIPAMIPHPLWRILGCLGSALIAPVGFLGWTLYCYEIFDKHLNPLVCPDLIGKGIFPPK